MKIKNNQIVEISKEEAFLYWLRHEIDDLMSFPDFLESLRDGQTRITEKDHSHNGGLVCPIKN